MSATPPLPAPASARFWVIPVAARRVASMHGITARRVRVVRDQPIPGLPDAYEGFALLDQATGRLLRLFVVRPRDHLILEWPMQADALGELELGIPVRHSARSALDQELPP